MHFFRVEQHTKRAHMDHPQVRRSVKRFLSNVTKHCQTTNQTTLRKVRPLWKKKCGRLFQLCSLLVVFWFLVSFRFVWFLLVIGCLFLKMVSLFYKFNKSQNLFFRFSAKLNFKSLRQSCEDSQKEKKNLEWNMKSNCTALFF